MGHGMMKNIQLPRGEARGEMGVFKTSGIGTEIG